MSERLEIFPVEISMERLNGKHNEEILVEEQEVELSTSSEDQALKQKDPLAGDWSKLQGDIDIGESREKLYIMRQKEQELREESRF